MTNITAETVNGITFISVAGHANYSKDHNDIVCAAVSAISQSFLNALKVYEKSGACRIINEDIDEKLGVLNFSYKSINEEITNALLVMAIAGFSTLEKAYPENVNLNI